MENQHVLSFYISLFGTFFTFAYGPDAMMLTGLLVLMVADYATGIAASVVDKGLCSKVGFRGLLKKFVVLIIVAVTHHLDLMLQMDVLMLGALYFYSLLELISITENAGRLGIPMPATVKHAIRTLKEKVGDEDGSDVAREVSDHEVSSERTE